MNHLSGSCLVKYCLSKFRFTRYYKYTKPNSYEDTNPSIESLTAEWLTKGMCLSNFRVPSDQTRWVQVRYRCDRPPKYVRDLDFPSFDNYRKDEFKKPTVSTRNLNENKQNVSYLIGLVGFMGTAYAAKTQVTYLVSYMSASADVLALANIEVELGKIAPGACVSFKWRGKPLFVKHRTEADIELESKTPLSSLKDPQTPEARAKNQKWLIVIGICTHLGCVPIPNTGDFPGGFYCPCHGSHYDNVGRARKGPAPLNLEVPPYIFLSEDKVLVG